MLDAYAVKKMIPRLIMAIVLVNLSFFICVTLLDFSNTVGNSISDLVLGAFNISATEGTAPDTDEIQNFSSLEQVGILGIGGVGLFAAWPSILPTLMLGAIALFVGYLVVIIRQIFIIIMIIIAPVAIALWVLPGTENYAKKWFDFYIKLLLMYPLIIIFLDAGLIISSIASQDTDMVMTVIAIIARVIPYFMIAFTLKFIGGAMSSIAGVVNNKSKGLVDRSQKWGDEKKAGSDRAYRKNQAKASRQQRQAVRVATKASELDSGRLKGVRNFRRNQQVRKMAGLSLTDMARQGIANKSGQDWVGPAGGTDAAARLRADLKVKVDETELKAALQNLKLKVSGLDAGASKVEIEQAFKDAVSSGDGVGARAAMNQMAQLKGVTELERMQDRVFNNQDTKMMETWNSGLSENYSEMKALSPHLAVGFDKTKHMGGTKGAPPASAVAELETARKKAFADASLELLAGMKKEGWAKYSGYAPAEASAKRATIEGNETLKGKLSP